MKQTRKERMITVALTVLILAVIVVLASCSFQPIVDQPNAGYQQDLAECRAQAERTAGPGTTAAAGAVIGAGLGFALCAAFGGRDCGTTARGTAVMGSAYGAAGGAQNEAQVVRNCLVGRGHRVLN